MQFARINHVGVPVTDMDRARRFYTDVLGLAPHPEKSNWLGHGQGCPIHLMPRTTEPPGGAVEHARHVALEISRLEDAVALLLRHGLAPYQADIEQNEHRPITSLDQPLDFGIGTVFVTDADGNVVEFIERGRGIFGRFDPR